MEIPEEGHPNCIPFPLSGDATLLKGIPRNFEVYDPLDFLAEVTQHIPNKGEHQVRYYGHYSNKKRGMREKKSPAQHSVLGMPEPDTPFRRKCRITWAALIKAVFEVDPLKCPKCGGTMKIVGLIEEENVIERSFGTPSSAVLLRRRTAKSGRMRHPVHHLKKSIEPTATLVAEPQLDYDFFAQNCI